ncbi:MAG: Asp-tRNA(Asn)/Glu-tRNA(Gln) amidotransferase subunit GatA [Elusimicrobia bacterium]|nr:Asp-tRNA(Asn)/Glu-tRNA(Gln) amidotransferase subunit GatA [Elusimicrobiota bacterium]
MEEIARAVREGRLSAEEAVSSHLERIKSIDANIRAFLLVLEDFALEQARIVDKKRKAGRPLGLLAGVPVAVKDNILVQGFETTAGSRILKGYKAAYDASVVERLKREDAVILGKTNLDEFAMGSSTENSAFFKTANPWNTACVPGGSSGGSAAAVAAAMCPLALGSDTGGSIRQPAAFCGIVGLKPTYGLVSRYGLIAFGSSLDQIGPFTRTVSDSVLALRVIGGRDERDSTSADKSVEEALSGWEAGIEGLRIGVPREFFIKGLDPEVEASVRGSIETLESLGARVEEVSLPHSRYAIATYYIIAPSEASSNLARFDGVRYAFRAPGGQGLEELYERTRGQGFGPEVKRRIMLGTYALSSGYYQAYYGKAQRARTLIKRDFEQAFRKVDLIAGPTAPTAAFRFGEKTEDPMAMYLSDIFTIPSNMAGNASVSIPCGLSKAGLPMGLQLIAPAFGEGTLFRASKALEAARPFPGLAEVA